MRAERSPAISSDGRRSRRWCCHIALPPLPLQRRLKMRSETRCVELDLCFIGMF